MSRKPFKVLLILSVGLYTLCRWGANWGATTAEALGHWPGDDIVPQPQIVTTHVVTIHAAPSQVWPWVVQLGYYRGGWHTDTSWWDYLADRYLRRIVREDVAKTGQGHRDEPTATQINPEFQQLAVGDIILDGPPGTAYFTVTALEPERILALHSNTHARYLFPQSIRDNPCWGIGGEFGWVFILAETAEGDTRLLLRTRTVAQTPPYRLLLVALLPVIDGMMARKMLTSIQQQVEQSSIRSMTLEERLSE